MLETKYQHDSFCDICPLHIKRYFDIQEIQTMIDTFVPTLSYRVRGLYFVPLKPSYSKILYLFTDEDYKETNSVKKTSVTFRIIQTPTPDIYELYLHNEQRSMLQKHSYARIPDLKTSEWIKKLTDLKDEVNVECKYQPSFQKWCPLKEGSRIDTVVDCP